MAGSGDRTGGARSPSRAEVKHLVGDLDDAVITAIIATGASYAEIELAAAQAGSELDLPARGEGRLDPIAEAVYDILVKDPGFSAIERDR